MNPKKGSHSGAISFAAEEMEFRIWEYKARRKSKFCLHPHVHPLVSHLEHQTLPSWLWVSISNVIRAYLVRGSCFKKKKNLVLLLSFQPTDLYFTGSRRANGSHPKKAALKTDVLCLSISIFLPHKSGVCFPQQICLVHQKEETTQEGNLWPLCQGKPDYSLPRKAIFTSIWWAVRFVLKVNRRKQKGQPFNRQDFNPLS